MKELIKLINKEETNMNMELFQKYINFQMLSAILRDLFCRKDKNKNNNLVDAIKSELSVLREEIEEMSENEIEIEKPDKTVDIIEKILEFNRQNNRTRIKMLTPEQMLSRLPITLAQLKSENNTENLNNEIRQLLYSLYRSKRLSKTIYNGLIKTI